MDTHACYNNGWITLATAERSCLSGIRRMLHCKEKCYNKRLALLKVSSSKSFFCPAQTHLTILLLFQLDNFI